MVSFLRVRSLASTVLSALCLQLVLAASPANAATVIGTTTVLGAADSDPAGLAEAFPAVAGASATVSQITLYVDAHNAATRIDVGLYSDAGGHPGVLLAQGTIASPVAKTWGTANVGPVAVTQGQAYWLALLSPKGAGIVHFRDTATGGASETSALSTLAGLPSAWATGAAFTSSPVSMAALGDTSSGPVIAVAPSGLSFHAFVGGADPAPAVLSVTNAGGGTLVISATTDQPWLAAAPATATAPASESVQATIAGLAVGTYSANVSIASGGASNSPVTVPVVLTVDASSGNSRDWPTVGQNAARTSFAANDQTIDHTNVGRLRLQWSANLDGKVSAQPLFLGDVTIGGVAHDVVLGASNQNSLYAFDADTGATLWHVKLGADAGGSDYAVPGGLGIRGAPVVDRTTDRIYVVSDNGRLHTIALATGVEIGKPLQLIDLPLTNKVRGGLNLFNGSLYIANGSDGGDTAPWRGRVYRVDVSGPAPVLAATFDVVPGISGNNRGGGIWSYGGVSVDPASGNVYTATGEDFQGGLTPYARRMLALTPGLGLIGSYKPPEFDTFSCDGAPCDLDFSATPTVFTPTGCPTFVAGGSKDGTLYILRTKDFAADTPLYQGMSIAVPYDPLALGGVGGVPAFWPAGNMLFVTDSGTGANGVPAGVVALAISPAPACAFSVAWSQALPDLGSAQSSATVVGDVVLMGQGATGEVHAYAAADGTELWNSGSTVTGNTFAAPSVGGGKVFVGSWVGDKTKSRGVVRAFGLPPGALARGGADAAQPRGR